MPTQRPSYFGSFLAAFRAHSQPLHKSQNPITQSAAAAAGGTASIWTAAPQQSNKSSASSGTDTAVTSPKPIHPKTNPYNSQSSTAQPERQLVSSYSTPLEHNVSPLTHLPRSPPSPGLPMYGPQNKPQPHYPSMQDVRRSRRGSDSSSEGFREVRGAGGEKWFIGGLTASGEERYYKLNMVKRDKSSDRISTDQMSL